MLYLSQVGKDADLQRVSLNPTTMGLTKKTQWSDLWKKEDWLACWLGLIIIAIGCVAVLTGWFDFSALKFSTWSLGEKAATKAVPLGE